MESPADLEDPVTAAGAEHRQPKLRQYFDKLGIGIAVQITGTGLMRHQLDVFVLLLIHGDGQYPGVSLH